MKAENNRAFKEWAMVCQAMKDGLHTVLIRKGGIREEEGVFRINDSEFFLMPTYEHQNSELLQPDFIPMLQSIQAKPHKPNSMTIDAYAVVDTIVTCDDEERLRRLSHEHVWNDRYLQMRLDFNPYDPLYVLLLRVYALPERIELAMKPEFEGCKSWVTLDRSITTAGAVPAVGEDEFARRRTLVLGILGCRAVTL